MCPRDILIRSRDILRKQKSIINCRCQPFFNTVLISPCSAGAGKHCLGIGSVGPPVYTLLPEGAQPVAGRDARLPAPRVAAAVPGGAHPQAGGAGSGLRHFSY
jgi:hypothetical protein